MILYFEIGPLKEREYTGIAQVTAALSEQILADRTIESHFFFGRMAVPRAVVRDLVKRRNGDLLEWYLQKCQPATVPLQLSPDNVAVFPNRKTGHRVFSRECQIIHDLSTLLTPQFHHIDTINYHATTLEKDMLSNDLTFCVSSTTRADVLAYFPALREETVHTLHLAASLDRRSEMGGAVGRAESYILVLGTIEPRKNASQVLNYIREHSGFLKQHRFVFLGRFGWGITIEDMIREYHLKEAIEEERILFPGFVSEHAKTLLIKNAELVVYPSLFEGFGLPLLEAATLGVPCVTTRSSSLPEVGGDVCYFFDPFTQGDFDRALIRAILDLEVQGAEVRRKCVAWADNFSWEKTYSRMKHLMFSS